MMLANLGFGVLRIHPEAQGHPENADWPLVNGSKHRWLLM
jgi:hypothetical protein